MPYLLLFIGIVIALFALYKFFIRADVRQIKALFLTAFFTIVAIALLILALTGRLPAALGLLAAMTPFAFSYLRDKNKKPTIKDNGIIDIEPIEDDEGEGNDT